MYITVDLDKPKHQILLKALEGTKMEVVSKNKKVYVLTAYGDDLDRALAIRYDYAKIYDGIPKFYKEDAANGN